VPAVVPGCKAKAIVGAADRRFNSWFSVLMIWLTAALLDLQDSPSTLVDERSSDGPIRVPSAGLVLANAADPRAH
jgi:hypothetical protein